VRCQLVVLRGVVLVDPDRAPTIKLLARHPLRLYAVRWDKALIARTRGSDQSWTKSRGQSSGTFINTGVRSSRIKVYKHFMRGSIPTRAANFLKNLVPAAPQKKIGQSGLLEARNCTCNLVLECAVGPCVAKAGNAAGRGVES
jgi:hypothetical protein